MVSWHLPGRVSDMVMRIRTVMVSHGAGLWRTCWDDQQSIPLPWFSSISRGINDANFTSKIPLLLLSQTLTNALLKTNVTRMLHVTTPKDLTTALAKEDLKATGELTARVRFCWRAYLSSKSEWNISFFRNAESFQQHLSEFAWQHKNF